jgi:hypothetical protein
VGKTVYSRSARNLPPHRPKKVFDREEVARLRGQRRSYRQIAASLGLGLGTVVRILREGPGRPPAPMTIQDSQPFPQFHGVQDLNSRSVISTSLTRCESRQIFPFFHRSYSARPDSA